MMKKRCVNSLKIACVFAALHIPVSFAENVTFWHGQTGKLGDAVQLLCQNYNNSQGKHTVNCIGQGGNEVLMQKTIASYRTKSNPEMVLGFDAGTLDFMLSGAIIPVYELAKRMGEQINWHDYILGIRSYYESSKGELYAQPFNASTVILIGNQQILNKAGVQKLPESWEAFGRTLEKLKQNGVNCPFSTDGHSWRYLEQFSAIQGEAVATHGNGYSSLNNQYLFDTTSHLKIMKDLVKWRNAGLLKLNADTLAGNYVAAFTSGECAMSLVSTGAYGQAWLALGGKTALMIGKMPAYEGTPRFNSTVGGGAIWVMKGHSEEKYRAVLDFLDYVRRPDVQLQYVRQTGFLPVTRQAYEQIINAPDADSAGFATVKTGIASLSEVANSNTKGIRLGFFVQFREVWTEETQKAFTGKQTMEQAIQQAKLRGDQLLGRFARTYKNQQLP
ncbi:extracellular solute-binding protein [Serratia entomophila]|uniref:extracellular solute-binding protein n=1 Tax=Serratia entomophila TaxID=42906 RepID=UPI0021784F41|nr:extracellular solute-binding protein [Serratia entomophila]CAI1058149.1 glycerol-3-phosphate transporter periplasmic binding protein [Serratia entomophila]CAI1790420.1 glycerol-3-phosphate transporter periplasmic binding protein [Serratia entomophila]CAI1830028.1 glycerol-3-phosphate transporter periplasmic binding protein [Serratia entomophila]CAI1844312.1 glycerol-3-phosphate transporter periplasmic binding protein [Serratia entomophila]CAI1914311.1 glycerol-3-phosphate transporter peripl